MPDSFGDLSVELIGLANIGEALGHFYVSFIRGDGWCRSTIRSWELGCR